MGLGVLNRAAANVTPDSLLSLLRLLLPVKFSPNLQQAFAGTEKGQLTTMDSHLADNKLKELHVESLTVRANDRTAAKYEIDAVAERRLLRKVDLRLM